MIAGDGVADAADAISAPDGALAGASAVGGDAVTADGGSADDSALVAQSRNLVFFVRDLLADKLPLRLDFGAEPNTHGSKLFVGVQYDWNDLLGSRVRFEYDNSATMDNSGDDVVNERTRTYGVYAYPFVLYVGDAAHDARTAFLRLDFGGYYSYARSQITTGSFFSQTVESGEYAGYVIQRQQTDYQLLGSSFGYSLQVPLVKYVAVGFEGYIQPLYFVILRSATEYTITTGAASVPYSYSLGSRRLSYPAVGQSIAFDFFSYFRIKAAFSYQRLTMNLAGADDIGNETALDYTLHTMTLRYGGELLKPSKTRRKTSHLWAGVYYEMVWSRFEMSAETISDYAGKWVFCFGT